MTQPDLRTLVASRGSIADVARKLGDIPENTLRTWCTGHRTPPAYVLAAVRLRIEALAPVTQGEKR